MVSSHPKHDNFLRPYSLRFLTLFIRKSTSTTPSTSTPMSEELLLKLTARPSKSKSSQKKPKTQRNSKL